MTGKYQSFDDRNYESIYIHIDTTIEYPVAKVWPHALNIGQWMSAHALETLSGEPGKVGHFERVAPRNVGKDVKEPRYHLYGLAEIIPYKFIGLEVLPERGGSYGNSREWVSFDGIILVDMGATTKLIFHMVDMHYGKGEPGFEQKRKAELEEASNRLLKQYFDNLKRLVAQAEAA